MTKTCGECRHFYDYEHRATPCWSKPTDKACREFELKVLTNGDKIITGGIKELVKFHLLGTCDTCIYYNKEYASHNDICLCPKDKTCADGVEAWLNAPSESGVSNG